MPMFITAERLRRAGACQDQRETFEEIFPSGVEVTEALCIEHADKFDWEWAAGALLSPEALHIYMAAARPARDTYQAIVAPVLIVYEVAIKLAWNTYAAAITAARSSYNQALAQGACDAARESACDAARESAWDAYDAAAKPAEDAYDAIVKPAIGAYDAALAAAFAQAARAN
jgi:hypothetical protein